MATVNNNNNNNNKTNEAEAERTMERKKKQTQKAKTERNLPPACWPWRQPAVQHWVHSSTLPCVLHLEASAPAAPSWTPWKTGTPDPATHTIIYFFALVFLLTILITAAELLLGFHQKGAPKGPPEWKEGPYTQPITNWLNCLFAQLSLGSLTNYTLFLNWVSDECLDRQTWFPQLKELYFVSELSVRWTFRSPNLVPTVQRTILCFWVERQMNV